MDFNILNILSQFLSNTQPTQNTVNNTYNSDYPDVFFTKTTNHQNDLNNMNSSSQINNFNLGGLANLLPMFLNKSSNNNISKILENFNPQLSKITTLFNKKEKTPPNKNEQPAPSIIDLSDYTELS